MLSFKGMRFPIDVILVCIRWYVAYPLSYRHLEEMMEERRVSVGSVALAVNCRNFSRLGCPSSNWTDLSCQRVKSVCERHYIDAIDRKLVLANHVHELNAGEHAGSRAE